MGFWDDIKKEQELQKYDRQLMRRNNVELEYLGGFKDITGKNIKVYQGTEPKTVVIQRITYSVVDIDWQQNHKRSAGKAAAGAIIGGVLTGGVGLLVGAAIGGRRKDASLAVISIIHNGEEHDLYVQCNPKEFKKLLELI